MISMYLLVVISIPTDMTRQQEENMIDLNKHALPSWQITERDDNVKLACVFNVQELNQIWIAHHK